MSGFSGARLLGHDRQLLIERLGSFVNTHDAPALRLAVVCTSCSVIRHLRDNLSVADPVAIVSIVSGAAVAISVPFISARLERSRFEQQSRDARQEQFGALLDEATRHLYDAWTILYEIEEEGRKKLPRPEWSEKYLRTRAERLTGQTDVVVHDELRIKLRTQPGSRIAAAYQEAVGFVLAYELHYRHFIEGELFDQEKPPPPPTGPMNLAIGQFMDEARRFVGVVESTPEEAHEAQAHKAHEARARLERFIDNARRAASGSTRRKD